jgi:hypothetical protein
MKLLDASIMAASRSTAALDMPATSLVIVLPPFLVALPVIVIVIIVAVIVVIVIRFRIGLGLWVRLGIWLGIWLGTGRRRLRSGRWGRVWPRWHIVPRKPATAALRAFWGQGQDKARLDVRGAGSQRQDQEKVFHFVTSGGAGKGIQWVGLKSTSYQSPLT